MQCVFTSWTSLRCYLRKNLIRKIHEDIKLNAGSQTDSNNETILMTFMRRRNVAVARLAIKLNMNIGHIFSCYKHN